MKQWTVRGVTVLATLLSSVGAAWASDYNTCTVSDVQYVKVGTVPHFVFKAACLNGTFFWYAPTDSEGRRLVSDIVLKAVELNRKIHVQCGTNGGGCASFSTKAYEGGVQGTKTIWSAETVSL